MPFPTQTRKEKRVEERVEKHIVDGQEVDVVVEVTVDVTVEFQEEPKRLFLFPAPMTVPAPTSGFALFSSL